jgi:hypothetical protein
MLPMIARPEKPEVSMSAKYDAYLRADCWRKQTRPAALARAGYVCQARIRCHGARATQAHHNNYACVGDERPADLLAVCAACHRALHGRPEPAPKAANDNEPMLPLFDEVEEVA